MYKYSFHITISEEKPDLVLWSETLRPIVLLELTIRTNRTCAQRTRERIRSTPSFGKHVVTRDIALIEIGVLGYVANSTKRALKTLGVWSKDLHGQISQLAMRCTYAIYVQRKTKSWTGWKMFSVTILPKGN